ncbi:NADPH-dependent FMN reductase [Solidesulfovibrio fructosivorans JJ]]|uniref:NADPH-dependent FMN reductase n=2 Tax=Solidesulfovibrio fructosivorans TaxID=878 RepID=E1JV19_SOLFR|nr:NADPH-dependent FMN reductase [Solidesulfovibrio fructosivorans JJ]]
MLLQAVLDGARGNGADGQAVHLREYRYEPCLGCEACRKAGVCTGLQDGMTLLYPKIEQCSGLALVSPVHQYNISARMKAFLDRLYCYYDFTNTRPRGWSSRLAGQGRKAVIGVVAEQAEKKDTGVALEAMRLPLAALGYDIVGEFIALGLFDLGRVAQHEDILAQAREAGKQLAGAL